MDTPPATPPAEAPNPESATSSGEVVAAPPVETDGSTPAANTLLASSDTDQKALETSTPQVAAKPKTPRDPSVTKAIVAAMFVVVVLSGLAVMAYMTNPK